MRTDDNRHGACAARLLRAPHGTGWHLHAPHAAQRAAKLRFVGGLGRLA